MFELSPKLPERIDKWGSLMYVSEEAVNDKDVLHSIKTKFIEHSREKFQKQLFYKHKIKVEPFLISHKKLKLYFVQELDSFVLQMIIGLYKQNNKIFALQGGNNV